MRAHHAVHPADAVRRRRRRVVLREHPRLGADGRRRGVELLRQDISKIQQAVLNSYVALSMNDKPWSFYLARRPITAVVPGMASAPVLLLRVMMSWRRSLAFPRLKLPLLLGSSDFPRRRVEVAGRPV